MNFKNKSWRVSFWDERKSKKKIASIRWAINKMTSILCMWKSLYVLSYIMMEMYLLMLCFLIIQIKTESGIFISVRVFKTYDMLTQVSFWHYTIRYFPFLSKSFLLHSFSWCIYRKKEWVKYHNPKTQSIIPFFSSLKQFLQNILVLYLLRD